MNRVAELEQEIVGCRALIRKSNDELRLAQNRVDAALQRLADLQEELIAEMRKESP